MTPCLKDTLEGHRVQRRQCHRDEAGARINTIRILYAQRYDQQATRASKGETRGSRVRPPRPPCRVILLGFRVGNKTVKKKIL